MSVTATTLEQADALAARLTERKERWLHVSIPDRILYLQRCLEDVRQSRQSGQQQHVVPKVLIQRQC
jgi:hypothetical protein